MKMNSIFPRLSRTLAAIIVTHATVLTHGRLINVFKHFYSITVVCFLLLRKDIPEAYGYCKKKLSF